MTVILKKSVFFCHRFTDAKFFISRLIEYFNELKVFRDVIKMMFRHKVHKVNFNEIANQINDLKYKIKIISASFAY